MSKKIMKKVSAFIGAVMASAIVFGGVSSANITSLKAENVKTDFSSKISAVSHANGQTVNILPEDLKLWNKSETFNADYLNGLYEYSSLHKDFVVVVNSSNSDLVDIYRQADAFNPVNNVLRWNSSLTNVESYTVRLNYE